MKKFLLLLVPLAIMLGVLRAENPTLADTNRGVSIISARFGIDTNGASVNKALIYNGLKPTWGTVVVTTGSQAFTVSSPLQYSAADGTNHFELTKMPLGDGTLFDQNAGSHTNGNATTFFSSGTLPNGRLSGSISLLGQIVELAAESDNNAALLTNGNASTFFIGGTIPDTRLSANVSLLGQIIELAAESDLNASALTNGNASTFFASGTIPESRLSQNAVNLTNANATTLFSSGTIPAARLSQNAANETNGNASTFFSSGTIPEARLSQNAVNWTNGNATTFFSSGTIPSARLPASLGASVGTDPIIVTSANGTNTFTLSTYLGVRYCGDGTTSSNIVSYGAMETYVAAHAGTGGSNIVTVATAPLANSYANGTNTLTISGYLGVVYGALGTTSSNLVTYGQLQSYVGGATNGLGSGSGNVNSNAALVNWNLAGTHNFGAINAQSLNVTNMQIGTVTITSTEIGGALMSNCTAVAGTAAGSIVTLAQLQSATSGITGGSANIAATSPIVNSFANNTNTLSLSSYLGTRYVADGTTYSNAVSYGVMTNYVAQNGGAGSDPASLTNLASLAGSPIFATTSNRMAWFLGLEGGTGITITDSSTSLVAAVSGLPVSAITGSTTQYVLTANGVGVAPTWTQATSGGDVYLSSQNVFTGPTQNMINVVAANLFVTNGGGVSVELKDRRLKDATGSQVLNWQTRGLYDATDVSVDWLNRKLQGAWTGTNQFGQATVFSLTSPNGWINIGRVTATNAGGVLVDTNSTQTLSGKTLVNPASTAQTLVYGAGATVLWDMNAGEFAKIVLTNNVTALTVSNLKVGTTALMPIQSGSGSYTIAWPSIVKWGNNGTVPTLSTTVGATDLCTWVSLGNLMQGLCSTNFK